VELDGLQRTAERISDAHFDLLRRVAEDRIRARGDCCEQVADSGHAGEAHEHYVIDSTGGSLRDDTATLSENGRNLAELADRIGKFDCRNAVFVSHRR